jgi:hypothetical protein
MHRSSQLRHFATWTLWSAALILASLVPARADDTELARLLKEKGVTLKETNGVVTGASVADGGKLTDADFGQLGKLSRLKTLDVNKGLNDDRLALLAGLAELEYFQSNLAQVTDAGLKPLAGLKGLRNLKFFHPGPAFSGAGLAHLAELPNLERLTVAGSLAFNDEGMAAVAKLAKLQDFRTWHAGVTDAGVKHLKELKNLKSLNLGQRLAYKPPVCPSDMTLALVAELKSLEVLQLSEARLTLAALRQLKQLPALKQLTLDGIDISKADVVRLKEDLPAAQIDWTEPNETYRKRIVALFGAE